MAKLIIKWLKFILERILQMYCVGNVLPRLIQLWMHSTYGMGVMFDLEGVEYGNLKSSLSL